MTESEAAIAQAAQQILREKMQQEKQRKQREKRTNRENLDGDKPYRTLKRSSRTIEYKGDRGCKTVPRVPPIKYRYSQ